MRSLAICVAVLGALAWSDRSAAASDVCGVTEGLPCPTTYISQAVAAARACLEGDQYCPVQYQCLPPTMSAICALKNQVQNTARACANGAPNCPAPVPSPPDIDAVYDAANAAVAIAEGCLNGSAICPVPPPDASPLQPLLALVYATAEACLNGASGCPAPVPDGEAQNVVVGLGGYRYCVTSDFVLDGTGLGTITPLLRTEYAVSGHASAQCTKDSTGQGGWVNVTLTFQGMEDGSVPCTAWGTGDYRIAGSLWLNDGSGSVEAPAALSVAISHLDTSVNIDLDLADNNMRASLRVFDVYPALATAPPLPPIPLPGSNACYQSALQQLHAAGSIDLLPRALAVTAQHAGVDEADLSSGYFLEPPQLFENQLPAEVRAQIPDEIGLAPPGRLQAAFPRFVPDGVTQAQAIDEALAQGLSLLIQTIGDALSPEAAAPGALIVPGETPYIVRVKYRTALGSTTSDVVGVPAVPTRIIVPNYNNSNIPEYLDVNVSFLDNGKSSINIIRQPGACVPLPVDVKVITPPLEQVHTLAGIRAEVGFEGLSVGGGAPSTFRLDVTQSSSQNVKSSSALAAMTHCTTAGLPVDIVGRYVNQGEGNDLTLRMQMTNPVTRLSFNSKTEGKKRTLAYRADKAVASIALTGMENGFEFNARLDDVAPTLDICSDSGTACLLPSRVYQCGCDAWVRRWGFYRTCVKPRYCPIPVETSISMSAVNRTGGYHPTTLNLKSHAPEYDNSGNVVGDTISTVTNAKFSQFALDSWMSSFPSHLYLDTRDQLVRGELVSKKVDRTGRQTAYTKLSLDSPGVTAWNRLGTVKRHHISFDACWPFNCEVSATWYTFHTSAA